jgi:hypothetical protein
LEKLEEMVLATKEHERAQKSVGMEFLWRDFFLNLRVLFRFASRLVLSLCSEVPSYEIFVAGCGRKEEPRIGKVWRGKWGLSPLVAVFQVGDISCVAFSIECFALC